MFDLAPDGTLIPAETGELIDRRDYDLLRAQADALAGALDNLLRQTFTPAFVANPNLRSCTEEEAQAFELLAAYRATMPENGPDLPQAPRTALPSHADASDAGGAA